MRLASCDESKRNKGLESCEYNIIIITITS
jgi:hypothetical protein